MGRADWLRKARWGVFTHYLADTIFRNEPITVEKWNKAVNSFDVERLAQTMSQVHAGYYMISIGQNSGYYCSPNRVYDEITGIKPSKCSERDLIADLYPALSAVGIPLMVYLPSNAPMNDENAKRAFGWQWGKYPIWEYFNKPIPDEGLRLAEFQRKWEAVIREWSVRWGSRVVGWWFDGCYYPYEMYYHDDPPNFESFAQAARAGNPYSIVAFNPGIVNAFVPMSPHEDYLAGEANEPEKVDCPGPQVGHAQFHMLSYLGEDWCKGMPRFSDEKVIAITQKILKKGGAVTWDVPITLTGEIPEPFVRQLNALGKALKQM